MEDQSRDTSGEDIESARRDAGGIRAGDIHDNAAATTRPSILLRLFTPFLAVWTLVSTCCGRRGLGGNQTEGSALIDNAGGNPTEGSPLIGNAGGNPTEGSPLIGNAVPIRRSPLFRLFTGLRAVWTLVSTCCGRRGSPGNTALLPVAAPSDEAPHLSNRQVQPAINANDGGEWSNFVKDSNEFIQWMITNIFLFLPVKTFFLYLSGDDLSSIREEILKLLKSLPQMFIPTVLLYTFFFFGARAFKGQNIRFGFELVSFFIGLGAMAEALAFAAADVWKWTLGAGIFYFLIFGICLIFDCCVNYPRN
ncbi:unnamed protein product [Microthlaspi erraticum]|uniref:Uncharacterized protein n=1 Tax=Microthlaspi erraticum TaxID=1685480 RepID=A0A6D2HE22_9BRAS|nr:unnamed protein product [Microthlaspi erraticum]